jgi:hypothetical protein
VNLAKLFLPHLIIRATHRICGQNGIVGQSLLEFVHLCRFHICAGAGSARELLGPREVGWKAECEERDRRSRLYGGNKRGTVGASLGWAPATRAPFRADTVGPCTN